MQQPAFNELSPDVGMLDLDAWSEAFAEDPDEALITLVAAHGSSDRALRDLARRLAGRVVLDLARSGNGRRRGVDRLRREPWTEGADLDLDSSLLAVADARGRGTAVDVDDLTARSWARSDHALCLVVDWSGSMGGDRLAAAALAAAVIALRAPDDYSVVAIARDAVIVKGQTDERPVDDVIDDVLSLRGFGTTNLELGVHAAIDQLHRSRSSRKVAVLLSDGNATVGGDPVAAARLLDELHVIAPPDSPPEAAELARVGGGRYVELTSPSKIPETLLALMR
jgi:Mg-chelatase subunit ChlD